MVRPGACTAAGLALDCAPELREGRRGQLGEPGADWAGTGWAWLPALLLQAGTASLRGPGGWWGWSKGVGEGKSPRHSCTDRWSAWPAHPPARGVDAAARRQPQQTRQLLHQWESWLLWGSDFAVLFDSLPAANTTPAGCPSGHNAVVLAAQQHTAPQNRATLALTAPSHLQYRPAPMQGGVHRGRPAQSSASLAADPLPVPRSSHPPTPHTPACLAPHPTQGIGQKLAAAAEKVIPGAPALELFFV